MSAKSPTFAVVIPAFNRGSFVGKAIASALSQTILPDEIIVVDDGSTDNTQAVIRQYPHPCRLIAIDNNGSGPSRPRNIGIAASTSQYITLLDSDDLLAPDLIERHRYLASTFPNVGLISNSYCINRFDHTQRVPATTIAELRKQEIAEATYLIARKVAYPSYCAANFIKTPGTTVHKSAWKRCGMFDESLRTSNDFDFFVRVLAQYDMIYIDLPLVTIVHHEHNISGSNIASPLRPELPLNHLRVQKREYRNLRGPGSRRKLRKSMAGYFLDLAYAYRQSGEYVNSAKSYLECVRWRTKVAAGLYGLAKLLPIAFARKFGLRRLASPRTEARKEAHEPLR
jgi:glycosyltransferase involved in cell wall biosynthesis